MNLGQSSEALRDRRIASAGLDVFETEPLVTDDPLTKLENVALFVRLTVPVGDTAPAYRHSALRRHE